MPVEPRLAFATIPELGRHWRAGEFTALELTDFFLQRLETIGRRYCAVVTITADRAREEARRADAERKAGRDRGPLHGIPYGAKDLLNTAGIPTSWGAGPLRDRTPDADATVIRKLSEAGAILVAKLAMVELAGGFGYRQADCTFSGIAGNAWNRDRWAGGSSSGPGTAVAAGLTPFAIGSETWGSIMTPAGYNGISGVRPTYGRVSRHGAMALSWSMDKLGPMARTAEDCSLVLAAIAGPDFADDTAVPLDFRHAPVVQVPRFRLATLKEAADKVQPEVRANYEQSLEVLKPFATFEEIKLPDYPYSAVAGTIISCEMAAAFEDFIAQGKVWELTAPEDRWGGHSGLTIPAKDYINALRIRRRMQRELDAWIAPFDAIVSPTLTTVAGPNNRPFAEWSRGYVNSSIGAAANVSGLPGITVLNGFGQDGLPTGLQFTSRAFAENRLLAVAQQYQQVTDWHTRSPDLTVAANKSSK